MTSSMDAMWASLRDDDSGYDREGYTPEPPDDDAPVLTSPLRPMPRPEPVIIRHAAPPPRPALPPMRGMYVGRTTPPPLPPRRPA